MKSRQQKTTQPTTRRENAGRTRTGLEMNALQQMAAAPEQEGAAAEQMAPTLLGAGPLPEGVFIELKGTPPGEQETFGEQKMTLREMMVRDMTNNGLKERTREAYQRVIWQLAKRFGVSPAKLGEGQVANHLVHLKTVMGFAPSSMRIVHAALRFFYTHTCPRDWELLSRMRSERQRTLPDILTVEEVHALINTFRTQHHRTFFWTVYSCGLRLEETLYLQVKDIDSGRMMIHVHRGKGASDRYVPLPEDTLQMLRDYWKTHRNPVWIFPARGRDLTEAAHATRPMPRTTVQGALRLAVKQCGIRKRVSTHTLRHCWATHALERGVSLRAIQRYLGHRSLQTTTLYLHLTSVGEEDAYRRLNELMSFPRPQPRPEPKELSPPPDPPPSPERVWPGPSLKKSPSGNVATLTAPEKKRPAKKKPTKKGPARKTPAGSAKKAAPSRRRRSKKGGRDGHAG